MANNNSSKHEIILVLPEGDTGWQTWGEISGIACCDIFAPEQETALKGIRNNFSGILILPLFAKEKKEIVPFGLNFIKRVRLQENYTCTPLFLVPSEIDIPPVPVTSDFVSSFAKEIVKNPSFGDDLKAVFFAELIYEQGSRDENILLNLLNLTDCNAQDIKNSAKKLNKLSYPELRKLFYHTFVTFYNPLGKIEKKHFSVKWSEFEKPLKLINGVDTYDGINAYDILTLANKAYNGLNGINKDSPHYVELELFRAPVPFRLNELVEAKNKIKTTLKTNEGNDETKNTIRLVLIDNKIDKVRNDKGLQTLGDLFKIDSELGRFFELKMLGDTSWTKISELSNGDNFKNEKSETFHFKEFGEGLEDYIGGNLKNQSKTKNQYFSKVYNLIREADFVLLDFFLNKENTYLAFDFIKDMAEIKKQEGDSSTTWYFITSAVYDSVVKYSQSGLLAEYYESAVVNAGDDPTNKKRQIIFLYKLLTFINARLNSFKGYKESIMKCRIFNKACGHNNDYCKKPEKCLFPVQSLCRKYTAEYNEITKIFPGTEEEKFKETVELLESIITQFLWLPEADWQIIQHQIDYINAKLKSIGEERKFSCSYILEEIKKRSNIY